MKLRRVPLDSEPGISPARPPRRSRPDALPVAYFLRTPKPQPRRLNSIRAPAISAPYPAQAGFDVAPSPVPLGTGPRGAGKHSPDSITFRPPLLLP
jgi:hypothetical protein